MTGRQTADRHGAKLGRVCVGMSYSISEFEPNWTSNCLSYNSCDYIRLKDIKLMGKRWNLDWNNARKLKSLSYYF